MPESTPKPTVLLQLDVDPLPSVFDGVVAVDSGVDFLMRHGGIESEQVRDLVHGLLFTRGLGDLKRSAVFVGGSKVEAAETLLKAVTAAFFGPFRVSMLMDANGCNTTAAAAVLTAEQALGGLSGVRAAVLGAGPVGRRVARLLARQGAAVAIGTPRVEEAREAAASVEAATGGKVEAFASSDLLSHHHATQVIVAAGPAGVTVLPLALRQSLKDLRVLIDLNAVPPVGVEGVEPVDRGVERDGVRVWGALGVGGLKMKIHKAAIRALFEANDRVFDAEAVFEVGRALI
jgi:hypothetical protein